MRWNANRVSNYTYHQRRFLVACLGLVGGLGMIAGAALGTQQGFTTRDSIAGFVGLALIIYFGLMAVRERRQAKAVA